MSESAQMLENITRWLGIAVTLLGAVVINPDATRHSMRNVAASSRTLGHQVRAWLSKIFPGLIRPRHIRVHVGEGIAVLDVTSSAHARGKVNAADDASIEERLGLLERRTDTLHDEVGQVQTELRNTEDRLRHEQLEATHALREESAGLRADVDAFRLETARTGASALPVIVVGIVLAGVAPDTEHGPWWLWSTGIAVACAFAGVRAAAVWRESRGNASRRLVGDDI